MQSYNILNTCDASIVRENEKGHSPSKKYIGVMVIENNVLTQCNVASSITCEFYQSCVVKVTEHS